MTNRLLPALASTLVLGLTGLALPAGTAAAGTGCAPVIDPSSVGYTPATLVIGSKGYRTQQAAASLTAPCAAENGSDLDVEVILSSADDLDGTLGVEDHDAAYPTEGAHAYGVFTEYRVRARDLHDADAGTWTTELVVTDESGNPAQDYDSVDGPSVQLLRASSVSANAGPEKVKAGKNVTVKGILARASWDKGKDVAYTKQQVQLQFRPVGGSFAAVTTVTSGKKGRLKATVPASVDGAYRFVYAGSSTTAAVTSKADSIDVK